MAHNIKLTQDDVRLIRELRREGLHYAVIAEKFEVGPTTVRDVVLDLRWREI